VLLVLAFLLMVVVGCQSREEALQLMCNAPLDCRECIMAPPEERVLLLSDYISEGVSNPHVRALFESFRDLSQEQRRTALQDALQEAGIGQCEFLRLFTPEGSGEP
jgi:hypothetical protein